jgi:endonuclease G
VKSAGNERTTDGHAKLILAPGAKDQFRWHAVSQARPEDIIELWFHPAEIKVRLRNPAGVDTPCCESSCPIVTGSFPGGNAYNIAYQPYFKTNGHTRVLVTIRPGSMVQIQPGNWTLDIVSGKLKVPCIVHAWVERIDSRPVRFLNHRDEEITLTIPGTARSVITVGAVESCPPLTNTDHSSYGPTRDARSECEKPDVVAPGKDIVAARAGTLAGTITMTGTSMAAPHVTGVIALLLSNRAKCRSVPIPTAAQIRVALCQQAQYHPGQHTPGFGFGLVDAEALLAAFPCPSTGISTKPASPPPPTTTRKRSMKAPK